MPSTYTICYYAMYVIGEVESGWNWQSINYNDPITIGMMQWYGTRAAGLLARLRESVPDAYALLDAGLRSDLESHDTSSTYWTSYYLSQVKGQSIQRAFESRESHIAQEQQAIADFEGYISTLEGWGMSQSNPKALIFAMSMYHQSPRSAGNVVASAGGNATLERLYTTCLNDGVLGNYRTRYTTVYNRLKAWDGESDPPDFGQNGGLTSGGNSGISTTASKLVYAIQRGDQLIVYGRDEYSKGITFFPCGIQRWKCAVNADGTTIEGGNTGGGSGTVPQVVELYTSWVGRFRYDQGPGRLTPLESGYGDCSSTIWAAYHDAAGIDVGTWTGAMMQKGREIARGSGPNLPLSSMKPGDLVLYDWNGGDVDHVEMYIGNNQLCGHGGPGNGPTIKQNAQTYSGAARYWVVRRYA